MPNLMDYLEWRGDLTFTEAPLNEVDNLIFSLLSYVDLDGIVPDGIVPDGIVPDDPRKGRVTIRAAAAEYFFSHPEEGDRPLGLIIPADILILFRRMAHTRRFRDLELTGYINVISETRQTQFSALTLRLPEETLFVAFRGTDDTIIGWKEDFHLAIMDEVPAQRMAADYLNRLDVTPDTVLYVGGHSKGGNLAVWGAVHADEGVRAHIRRVYSNDGPGFSEGMVESEAYKALADRICVLLPEDSLVGLLLEHDEGYAVVKSNRKGLFQHDGLSWEVLGGQFLRAESLSSKGLRNDTVVRERIAAMSRDERREFIRLMFSLLESTGAKTLTDLHHGKTKAALTVVKSFREMSEEDRETASYLWDKLTGNRAVEHKPVTPSGTARKPPKPQKPDKGRIKVSFFPLFLP